MLLQIHELKKKNDAMADGVFDIDENEFVRRPTKIL